jgi:hypothetical protein
MNERELNNPEAVEIANRLLGMLSGLRVEMVGAILAALLGRWLAQHPAELQAAVLSIHIEMAMKVADENRPVVEQQRAAMAGAPSKARH